MLKPRKKRKKEEGRGWQVTELGSAKLTVLQAHG
jgi:hypothetical protein